ncbi:hypothetical protein [Streptomyces sp. NPDC093990]
MPFTWWSTETTDQAHLARGPTGTHNVATREMNALIVGKSITGQSACV